MITKETAPADAAPEVKTAEDAKADMDSARSAKMWKGRIQRCKTIRTKMVEAWSENVDYRRGKPFAQETDTDRVNVNLDWSLTKGKHAQLYSQTPRVYLTPKSEQFKAAVPVFQKQLNDRLGQANVGSAVDEAVLDAINASGIGVVMCDYQAKTVLEKVPLREEHKQLITDLSPEELEQAYASGMVPFTEDQKVLDVLFSANRISPSDLLWATEFTGSNFDNAPWIGRSGTMLWDEGKLAFKLTDDQKEDVCGGREKVDNLRDDSDNQADEEQVVEFDEIFYWAYRFDSSVKYFKQIRRVVFVHGVDEPVIDEDWSGQRFDKASGSYVGSCHFPIRVLTLTYISDDCIPPSDTAIGRPQILEMIRSRSLKIMQQERSLPIRWYDVNRIDPLVHDSLMRGTYQAFIPTNGDGSRSIGEIARASYPTESYELERTIKGDLQEQWQVGSNQIGNFATGERSASEANIVQQNFQTRIGYERARVGSFFTGIAEVMAGLVAIYDTFPLVGDQEIQRLDQGWDRTRLANEYVYYIRPDSTVLLDATQRIDRLMKLLNLVGKSGYINPKPIIEEIVALHEVDPATIVIDPQPPQEEKPKVAFSFKGDDMINPMAVAVMLAMGIVPSEEQLEEAKKMIESMGMPPAPPAPVDPNAPPEEPPMEEQMPPEEAMGDTRPEWTPPGRVTKRLDEPGG
jgi:hypothetical protein